MFGPELVDSMRMDTLEVCFRYETIPVVQGQAQGLRAPLLRHITWELAELNWRYKLVRRCAGKVVW